MNKLRDHTFACRNNACLSSSVLVRMARHRSSGAVGNASASVTAAPPAAAPLATLGRRSPPYPVADGAAAAAGGPLLPAEVARLVASGAWPLAVVVAPLVLLVLGCCRLPGGALSGRAVALPSRSASRRSSWREMEEAASCEGRGKGIATSRIRRQGLAGGRFRRQRSTREGKLIPAMWRGMHGEGAGGAGVVIWGVRGSAVRQACWGSAAWIDIGHQQVSLMTTPSHHDTSAPLSKRRQSERATCESHPRLPHPRLPHLVPVQLARRLPARALHQRVHGLQQPHVVKVGGDQAHNLGQRGVGLGSVQAGHWGRAREGDITRPRHNEHFLACSTRLIASGIAACARTTATRASSTIRPSLDPAQSCSPPTPTHPPLPPAPPAPPPACPPAPAPRGPGARRWRPGCGGRRRRCPQRTCRRTRTCAARRPAGGRAGDTGGSVRTWRVNA